MVDWSAGGIETELGWALNAVHSGYTRTAAGATAQVPGGSRGYQVLVAITTEAASTQLALAHRLGMDKNAMTFVVDALEQRGLVRRQPDPRDRRKRQVVATDDGRALLRAARAALRSVEEPLLRNLTPAEQVTLRHLLARAALDVSDPDACAE